MIHHKSDILVVGGGIAGAMAAIRARQDGADVLLVDKSWFGRSGCSAVASGVWATWMPGDDVDVWVDGFGGRNPMVRRHLLEKALPLTYELLLRTEEWGAKWIRHDKKLMRVNGAGVPVPHNAMMDGGAPQLMMAVRAEALRCGVRVLNRVMVQDLLTTDGQHPTTGRVCGAIGVHGRTGEIYVFEARCTIMCSGPFAFPWPVDEGGNLRLPGMPRNASGDGQAAMLRAGADMGKLEIGGGAIQPAQSYAAPGLEILFGLGGASVFVNRDGERFLAKGDLRREMFGRHGVTTTFWKEILAGRGPIRLDITQFSDSERRLIDRVIPIVVANHDTLGSDFVNDRPEYVCSYASGRASSGAGARLDEHMRTSLPGLFGAGNCTDGAYVSMGQILPWCAVMGWWAGEHAADEAAVTEVSDIDENQIAQLSNEMLAPLYRVDGPSFQSVRERLRGLYEDIGIVLSGDRLTTVIDRLNVIRRADVSRLRAGDSHELTKVLGLNNYCQVLDVVLRVLLRREESRGNVLREDFPYTDNENWLAYTVAQFGKQGLTLREEQVTLARDDPTPHTKSLHMFFREE